MENQYQSTDMPCKVFRRVACVNIYRHFSEEQFEIEPLKHAGVHFDLTVTYHIERYPITLEPMTISAGPSLLALVRTF